MNKKLLEQAWPARIDLLLTIGFGLLAGVVLVGQAFYLSRIINRVFLEGAGLLEVQAFLMILLALSLSRAGLVWAGQITAQRVAGQVKGDLRQRLARHLFALGPAYARDERSGELANTAVEGVEALDAYFSQYVPQLAMAALVPLAILVFVFPLDWTTGLVLLLTAPLIPIFMMLIGSAAKEMTNRQWGVLSRLSAHFLDVLQGLTTLKLLGRSREQIEVIRLISDRFRETTMNVLKVAFLSALVLELLATLSVAIVAVEIGLRLLYGYLEFEQALFVLVLAPEFYMPLRQLGARFHAGMSGVSAAKRIFEVLETPLPISQHVNTGDILSTPIPFDGRTAGYRPDFVHRRSSRFAVGRQQKVLKPADRDQARTSSLPDSGATTNTFAASSLPSICFDQVHYAYDHGERPALNGLSFKIRPGQKVALVGPSGAGKSTVAHLLLRFIEPGKGQIMVDGQNLAEFDPAAWRARLAWVPQQPYLFYGSVIDNIRLARPEAALEEVIEAARQAYADDFILTLPQGYETLIGERGARLSGGQAQRLALARAFLKDAPFLILDEATANLDPDYEAQIQAAIERLLENRTALIIAHRLNTVYRADKILVMANGRVVETGTHRSLVERPGLYQRLVTAYGG